MDSDDDLTNVEVVVDRDGPSSDEPLIAPAALTAAGQSLAQVPLAITARPDGTKAQKGVSQVQFLASNVHRVRSVVAIGFTQHGKTAFLRKLFGVPRRSHSVVADDARGTSCVCQVYGSVVSGGVDRRASQYISVVDTPGDPAFLADAAAGIALASTALLCVDSVEGLHPGATQHLRIAVQEGLTIVLILTKVDRLVVDLRLPPKDAHRHLAAIVDRVNVELSACGAGPLSVVRGQVLFVSSKLDICLSLPAVAQSYLAAPSSPLSSSASSPVVRALSPTDLARRLWGPVAYDAEEGRFVGQRTARGLPTSFSAFVLEPLYKVIATTLAGDTRFIDPTAKFATPAAALCAAVTHAYGPFVPNVVDALAPFLHAAIAPPTSRIHDTVGAACARLGVPLPALIASATLLANNALANSSSSSTGQASLVAIVRILRGSLRVGQSVAVFNGPASVTIAPVESLALRCVDGVTSVDRVGPGVIAFVGGLQDSVVPGTSVLFDEDALLPDVPLTSRTAVAASPPIRVALEPVHAASLPVFKEGLRRTCAQHPGCRYHVQATGDHVLTGPSETYLDVALRDLRLSECGTKHPLRLTDPFVRFAETVSAVPRGVLRRGEQDVGGSADGAKVELSVVVGAATRELTEAFDRGSLSMALPRGELEAALSKSADAYGLDELEVEGLCAVGPDPHFGTNWLFRDFTSTAVEEDELRSQGVLSGGQLPQVVLDAIAAGFRTATREGPILGEMLRGVKVYLVEASVPLLSTVGNRQQLLHKVSELTRQVVRAAVLSAAPRLMEPTVSIDVITHPQEVPAIKEGLAKRRGNVTSEAAMPATPLTRVQGVVPLLDSFGLETELRTKTNGQATCTSTLAHWSTVPGDPLDDSITLLPLQAASGAQLARDFTLKTRRRNGLPDAVELL